MENEQKSLDEEHIRLEEIAQKYNALEDTTQIANSTYLLELAKFGQEGVDVALQKINSLTNNYEKDTAIFILAKAVYENGNDCNLALKLGDMFNDTNEKDRLKIHLKNIARERKDTEAMSVLG